MSRQSTHLRREQFLVAYKANTCSVSKACAAVDISRSTYFEWRQDPAFAARLVEVEEALIDELEGIAYEKARGGDSEWLRECLKVKAVRRGWSRREEQALTGNITVELVRKVINGPDQGATTLQG